MKEKGQISVEYLIIIGFVFAVLIPGVYMFYSYTIGQTDKASVDIVNKIGNEIVNSAESMFLVGENSWITLDIVFPEQVVDYYILDGTELIIVYETQRGRTENVFFSNVFISGDIDRDGGPGDPPFSNSDISSSAHPGLVDVKIESKGDWVSVSEIT